MVQYKGVQLKSKLQHGNPSGRSTTAPPPTQVLLRLILARKLWCALLKILCYYLVNETNLVHNLFSAYFVNIIITSTCFGPLHVHHQEEQLYLCDTWCVLFCIADCLPDSQLYRTTSTKCCINTVVSPDDGRGEVRNMESLYIILTKYTENKLCTKLVSFTR